MKTDEKEQLQNRLDEIREQELQQIIDKAYPEFEVLVGKTFKCKNCDSLPKKPSDYWWLYSKVTALEKSDIYLGGWYKAKVEERPVLATCEALRFQKDKNGQITVCKERTYVHSLGEEISIESFNKAYADIQSIINELNKK